MEPQNTQSMSVDEARVSMGLATSLNDELMKSQNPLEATISPETAPGQEQTGQQPQDVSSELESFKSEVMAELKSIKSEIGKEDDPQKEIADIRKELEALQKEDGQETED